MPYHDVQLRVSRNQLRNVARGRPIQVKAADIAHGSGTRFHLEEGMVRKLANAKRKGKGCRVCLSEKEIEGSGFRDMVKSAYKGVKEVATDLYQNRENIKGAIREGADFYKELKKLYKELKGSGMSDAEAKKALKDLGYNQKQMKGAGIFDDFVKGVRKGLRGAKKVNKYASIVPGLGEFTAPLAAAADISEKGLDVIEDVRRSRRGKGIVHGDPVNIVGPNPRRQNEVKLNKQYSDFYSIVMNPPKGIHGSGLYLGREGSGLELY